MNQPRASEATGKIEKDSLSGKNWPDAAYEFSLIFKSLQSLFVKNYKNCLGKLTMMKNTQTSLPDICHTIKHPNTAVWVWGRLNFLILIGKFTLHSARGVSLSKNLVHLCQKSFCFQEKSVKNPWKSHCFEKSRTLFQKSDTPLGIQSVMKIFE